MPFDPSLPQANTPVDAVQMRDQLNGLNAEILLRATTADITAAIATTSSNSNAVALLAQAADTVYNQGQIQSILDKIDELINALRR